MHRTKRAQGESSCHGGDDEAGKHGSRTGPGRWRYPRPKLTVLAVEVDDPTLWFHCHDPPSARLPMGS
jgi:hypothetical protein